MPRRGPRLGGATQTLELAAAEHIFSRGDVGGEGALPAVELPGHSLARLEGTRTLSSCKFLVSGGLPACQYLRGCACVCVHYLTV